MSDLAPGPRPRRSTHRQAIALAAVVFVLLGSVRAVARTFTDRALSEPLTVRAFGATLAVSGAMLAVASRRGWGGPRRAVGGAIGVCIAAIGFAKVVLPTSVVPFLGTTVWPRDGLLLVVVGVIVGAMAAFR